MEQEIHLTFGVIFSLLVTALTVIGFFIKGKMKTYDEHIANPELHQTENERMKLAEGLQRQLEAHDKLDTVRFDHIKETMELILEEVRKPRGNAAGR